MIRVHWKLVPMVVLAVLAWFVLLPSLALILHYRLRIAAALLVIALPWGLLSFFLGLLLIGWDRWRAGSAR